ncbi:hypothetical protein EBME_1698 [bacterium endosymbiont of Mortierella elongata FMR23-6]|nr:hypothetical protein EBME_1698 [bacterium endosymbiont of Mortierella elongata FMR23-6]
MIFANNQGVGVDDRAGGTYPFTFFAPDFRAVPLSKISLFPRVKSDNWYYQTCICFVKTGVFKESIDFGKGN